MTLEEAEKIVQEWSRHVEYHYPILHAIFLSSIPESFLPFPASVIEEASNIVAERHHYARNFKVVEAVQRCMGIVVAYENDDKALEDTASYLGDPKMREVVIMGIRKFQQNEKKLHYVVD